MVKTHIIVKKKKEKRKERERKKVSGEWYKELDGFQL